MALIGKIREKSWLLLIVVGGAIVTFIFTSQGPNFGGAPEEEYGIGLMYGEKLDREAFDKMRREADEAAEQSARQTGQEKQPVNEEALWNQFVDEQLLGKEFEALGIHVSDDEFDAYLYGRNGFKPPSDIANAQQFKDAQGNFDPKALEKLVNDLKNSDDPEMRKSWERSQEYYMKQRERQKYFDILNQGLYVTSLEAKQDYLANNEKKAVEFVAVNYNMVPDNIVKVDDKKLRAFYKKDKEKHASLYVNRASEHTIHWADITIAPSAKDSADFRNTIAKLKANLKKAKNDSLFVMQNSDYKVYGSKLGYRPEGSQNTYAVRGQLVYPASMDSTFRNAEVGTVIGPYEQNDATRLAKVVSKGPLLSVRHILVGAQRADTLAVEKAEVTRDSLMAIVNKDNFEELAMKHSDDHQPGQPVKDGGKYENFISGEMVPEFEEFAKDKPVGTIGYVQTDFGFHIIEVLGREENVVPNLAIVQKKLMPSTETLTELEGNAYALLDDMYKKIGAISNNYKKVEKFDTLASRNDMFVRTITINDNSPKISSFTSGYAENELFKLAYSEGAQIGDLISSPLKDGDRWIVAILSDVKEKGKSTFENARRTVEDEYIKEKKYEYLLSKMKGKSLQQIADAENVPVQNAEVVFARSTMGTRSGSEPQVVGALFSGLPDGKMTRPLKGTAGVYVVMIKQSFAATEAASYDEEKSQKLAVLKSRTQGAAMNALKDMAEIVDNRKFYEISIRR